MQRHMLGMAMALGLVACGGGSEGGGPAAPAATARIAKAFPQLAAIPRLVFLGAAPGDTHNLYLVTQGGQILALENRADVGAATPFLDLTARVTQRGGEEGLLGLAFHPDYASNGLFYVYYSPADGARRTRLSRFTANAARSAGDPASERVLLEIDQPPDFGNHKGGGLVFGPDGRLYVGVGDGGGGGDPFNNAQNLGTPLGKILRLLADGNDADGGIPPDNPLVGRSGARGEVWAWGLRNPWRIAFDGSTLWAADVGQDQREEIDLIEPGANYGWRVFEGTLRYNADDPVPAGHRAPLFEYSHDDGNCSITGGYVYRGRALPVLAGHYLYADFCSGRVWSLQNLDGALQNAEIGSVPGRPTSFGRDTEGELYLTALDGSIYKIQP